MAVCRFARGFSAGKPPVLNAGLHHKISIACTHVTRVCVYIEWVKLAKKDLKGADPATLIWNTPEVTTHVLA